MKTENKGIWPEAPAHLSEKAKELFNFYVGRTIKAPGQIALFVRGLESMDTADQCATLIRDQGLFQVSARSGMPRQNPLLNTQNEATAQMLKVWKELHLNVNQCRTADGFGYENLT